MGAARIRKSRHREWSGFARGRLRKTADAIADAGITPGTNVTSFSPTFANASNEVTLTDGPATGALAIFHNPDGALPAELEEGVGYYVNEASADTYTLHTSKSAAVAGSGAVAFTDDGTGNPVAYVLG